MHKKQKNLQIDIDFILIFCIFVGVFDTIFELSELLEMDEYTRDKIIDNMTTERDLINQFAYARKEGLAEGKAEGRSEGRAEVARQLIALGVDIETISKATGFSLEEIQNV